MYDLLRVLFAVNENSLVSAMYKVGDDLRQDMLTLQMVCLLLPKVFPPRLHLIVFLSGAYYGQIVAETWT
jgi:hypothetical protein